MSSVRLRLNGFVFCFVVTVNAGIATIELGQIQFKLFMVFGKNTASFLGFLVNTFLNLNAPDF